MKKLLRIGALLMFVIPTMFYMACSCKGSNFEVMTLTGQVTEFSCGDQFTLGEGIEIKVASKDNKKSQTLSTSGLQQQGDSQVFTNEDIKVDYTAYNNQVAGTYEIIVTYQKDTNIKFTYSVKVNAKTFASSDFEVRNYVGEYDGKTHSIQINFKDEFDTSDVKITYGRERGNYIYEEPIKRINVQLDTDGKAVPFVVYYKVEKPNYTPVEGSGIITINQKKLVVTPKDATIKYKEGLTNNGCSFEGFIQGETVNDLRGFASFSSIYKSGDINTGVVGQYPLEVTGYHSDNYAIEYKTGTLYVEKAENNIQLAIPSITYGSELRYEVLSPATDEFTCLYSVQGSNDWKTEKPKNVGVYEIKVSTPATTNYNAATKTQVFSITKKVLTVTAGNEAITYGEEFDLTKTRVPTIEGFADGEGVEVLSGSLVYSSTYQKGNNAGIDKYVISLTGYTSNNYEIVYRSGKLTVNKAKYQIDATAESKVYDGKNITLQNEVYPQEAAVTHSYQVVGT
ncbi:MAG: bacterial Ig-like domain-containing protein [Clostridia bacterium]|nr:bacterial Ig-like domain-containing protein [Clostridia bacterium]